MAFSVANNRLTSTDGGVDQVETSKMGGVLNARFLVIHYTAGASFDSDLKSLAKDNETKASVHLLIGRDGKIAQIVPFNRVAWHAGKSQWGEISGLNSHSIGIELSNYGVLTKLANGKFVTWFGKEVPDGEVMEAVHERGGPLRGWHTYPQKQLETLISVAHALQARFRFLDILGHDDISWARKSDPGPAFPMNSVRSRILGRHD
ncbi:N-acetylmuramoyl-L-alanine amidase [Neorhizobium huautlense]|uniref:N-acetylmuramoyl-L-alanine amidase n=1 Tax=Neorhizobium huautlense TaxID=67774 RepID=A0ABT9PP61_9HYPH|nr:N-acetylmuramoyl-L-alanine amidase [Neorhizobium huautlense]MDP9835971.1 N-acetylmuramoyl-L-alanine amidase [Neorhizobium huautlense]